MNSSIKDVVVFDLDDTLYKEIDFVRSGYKCISEYVQNKTGLSSVAVYDFMIGSFWNKSVNVFADTITKFKLNGIGATVQDFLEVYRTHIPNINLYGDAELVLNTLNSHFDVVMGIITDGRSETQNNKFFALGLDKWIDNNNLIISEAFGHSKPDAACYNFFMSKYPNANFWYVGDNTEKDFVGAKALGWKTFCLLDEGEGSQYPDIHVQKFNLTNEFLPDYKIDKLRDILPIICVVRHETNVG